MTLKKLLKMNVCFALLLFPIVMFGQNAKGKVTDKNGDPIVYASVIVKGTTQGTSTNESGEFDLNVSANSGTLVFSSVGFTVAEKKYTAGTYLTVVLSDDNVLEEVVVTGNRSKPRTILDSPVPVDNIGLSELKSSGQTSVDQMLAYKIPSYNSSTQAISDATAHFDPADLRGMGPSRTLVLINGKRKNLSAQVYLNDTPGKGEVGTDMKSIPVAAIERIEVLRDGASAQYGSDAVAGVVNIVLKEKSEYSILNVTSGITSQSDGFNFGADFNHTVSLGSGYINLSLGYYTQDITDRAGTPLNDAAFGVNANDPVYGPWLVANPDLGMTIGQSALDKYEAFFNAGLPFKNGKGEFYTFGGMTNRKGKSFAFYRAPYWRTTDYGLLTKSGETYGGYQPYFEADVTDNFNSVGAKFELFGFDADLSGTYGRNSVDYDITNTLNHSLGAASPTNFYAGGYVFDNLIGNLDFSKSYGATSVSFGAELRKENFEGLEGDPKSYFGSAADSFPGISPADAVDASRDTKALYAGVDVDFTEAFLIGGAARYEDFSDFGDNFSWKVNSRYKFSDNGTLRASYSTGFRAPSLHQKHLSNIQYNSSGGNLPVLEGTFANSNPILRDLGVGELKAEISKNIAAGLTYKFSPQMSFTLDLYQITVDDRVLLSTKINTADGVLDGSNPVEQVLIDNGVVGMKFFINAAETKTQGLDVLLNYKNIELYEGLLNVNLAANFNKTTLEGKINTPQILASNGYEIFDRVEAGRITSARPTSKVLLGFDYQLDKLSASLNNTYFGEVKYFNYNLSGAEDQVFSGKVVTDLVLNYAFSDKFSVNFAVTNLLDVYPDEVNEFGNSVGARFKYAWDVNQFGFNGTTFKGGITYKF
ncbi:MAG: TonB-dependent receptor [Flavobacteriaceae bacterium]|nr:TonB-dependent receptor [Flavobacteriaceae bacterium]